EADRRAALIKGSVIRKLLGVQLAAVVLPQVTKLLGDLRSALLHVARRERQVVVGGEVDVVRNGELEPALSGHAGRRREESRFSLIVEREIDRGRRDHVYSLEV